MAKVDVSNKGDFSFVADKVGKANQKVIDSGGFEMIPSKTCTDILTNLTHKGKKVRFAKASSIYALYCYLLMHKQNNLRKPEEKQSPKMLDRFEGSCYKSKSTICKELKMDSSSFDEYIEILIENGYLVRLIGTEFGIQAKYYWFPLLEADVEFCQKYSNDKIANPSNKNRNSSNLKQYQ